MAIFYGDSPKTPLMDASMSASMRRLVLTLWGLGFGLAATALAALLWSYDVADPSPFSATSQEATNWLGEPGAFIADTLMRYIGLGAWSVVLFLGAWSARFVLQLGPERIWARLIAALPFFILATVFSSTHAVHESWPLADTGLGGMMGDSGARGFLGMVPLPAVQALAVLSILLGLGVLCLGVIALGFSGEEIRRLGRWLGQSLGTVTRYGWLTASSGAATAARRIAEARTKPRSEKLEPAEPTGTWRLKMPTIPGALGRLQEARPDLPGILRDGTSGRDGEPPVRFDSDSVDGPYLDPDNDTGPETSGENDGPALRRAFDRMAEIDGPTEPLVAMPKPPIERPAPPATISRRAAAERQPSLLLDTSEAEVFEPPALALLQKPKHVVRAHSSDMALEENARMLETVLEDYGVRGEIVAVRPGPVVTLYELEPAPGLKASRVIGLSDDIARSMSALAARVSTVPGRSIIGIELPNADRETVWLRDLFEAKTYGDSRFPLALALGKDISGSPVVANLAKMPHLLIAGTTGSGKSVAINTMILSLLYRLSPKQCRLIMIDPKMLELSVYDNIPHLLAPVVTDPKKAIVALKWVVAEMEERYRKMSKMGVRNIDGYNARVRDALAKGEDFSRTVQTGFDDDTGEPVYETESLTPEEMPFIVVIVDEMADLMMVAGKEIEACIQRLAQMARASGIHLIMATQRPSVDVITGTIKANFPTRISFQVTSKIDSRTILGEQGAEQLLGQGDMLYMAGGGRITRVHGPFVSDEEVEEVVAYLKSLGTPDYVGAVTEGVDDEAQAAVDLKLGLAPAGSSDDELYDMAVAIVARDRKCSTSYIQRKLAIGYNKAARLVEQMEDQGVVTSANAVGKREILVEER
ncbi:MAG: DNA translocase FtsK [Pseudomonadota bacterium]